MADWKDKQEPFINYFDLPGFFLYMCTDIYFCGGGKLDEKKIKLTGNKSDSQKIISPWFPTHVGRNPQVLRLSFCFFTICHCRISTNRQHWELWRGLGNPVPFWRAYWHMWNVNLRAFVPISAWICRTQGSEWLWEEILYFCPVTIHHSLGLFWNQSQEFSCRLVLVMTAKAT